MDIHTAIIEIVSQHTRYDPITSAEIQKTLYLKDKVGQPVTRALILESIEIKKVAIGANSKGYYIINSYDELRDHIKHLNGRAIKIQKRAALVSKYFSIKHQTQLSLF